MGLARVGASVAAALAKAAIEEYSRNERARDDYERAAAKRAEQGYAAGRRGEARGDAEFDDIVNRHRRGLVGPLGPTPAQAPAVETNHNDSESAHDIVLADVAAFAVSDYYLDDDAIALGEAVLEGTIGAALASVPAHAGKNTKDCMVLGAVVRLVALLAQMTEQRLAAGESVSTAEDGPRVEVGVAGRGVDDDLIERVREAVTAATAQVLEPANMVSTDLGFDSEMSSPEGADATQPEDNGVRAFVGTQVVGDPEQRGAGKGKRDPGLMQPMFSRNLTRIDWKTSKGRPPLMGIAYIPDEDENRIGRGRR